MGRRVMLATMVLVAAAGYALLIEAINLPEEMAPFLAYGVVAGFIVGSPWAALAGL